MAEIIAEPTALSKVIPLKFKINDVDVPKTTQLSTNKQFNTTDTDAWFTFELDGLASTSGTYDLTLINLDDKSIFHHADVIFPALPFHYKLNSSEDVTLNEIRHAGRWLGQLVVTMSNGDTTARQFGFNIAGHILDGQDAQVILLSDYQALINTINLAKDELEQYNINYSDLLADIEAAETSRAQTFESYDNRIEQIETGVKHEVTNIIETNSDFTSTDGIATFGASVAVANNVMTITGSGSASNPNAGFNLLNIPTGKKIYMRVWARVLNDVCQKITIRSESTETSAIAANPVNGQWYELATVRTKTGALESAMNMSMTHTYADSATASGKTMEVKWAVAINLTDDFEAGSEPTADYTNLMLKIFPEKYFVGTQDVYPLQVLANDMNDAYQVIDDKFDAFVQTNIVQTEVAAVFDNLETTYAEDIVSVKSQLEQTNIIADTAAQKADAMASGSPKGVYATLALLQAAYPTGTTGAYLVGADGNWYYWSGSAWISGGVYQAVELVDGSVTFDKTEFFETYYDNLLDKTTITKAYLSAAGVPIAYESTNLSDFIPIEYGKSYKLPLNSYQADNVWSGHIYDANKADLGKYTATNYDYTVTNPNAAYIRVVWNKATLTDIDCMFVEGTVYPSVYVPHEVKLRITSPLLQEKIDAIAEGSVTPEITTFFKIEHTNMMDKATMQDGYLTIAGDFASSASAKVSDFIAVENGKSYIVTPDRTGSISDTWKGHLYGADKVSLGRLTLTNGTFTISNASAKYVRIVLVKPSAEYVLPDTDYMMIEGSIYPVNYIPYVADEIGFVDSAVKDAFKNKINKKDVLENLSYLALGDSITALVSGYHAKIAARTGLKVTNYGISGSTIADTGAATNPMSVRYTSMPDTADIVTVFGGTNDVLGTPRGTNADRTTATFYGACHVLFKGLAEKYAGKRLGVITPLQRTGVTDAQIMEVVAIEKEVAAYYGLPVLDLYSESGITSHSTAVSTFLLSDGLHPNDAGHELISRKIEAWLRTL